MTATLDSFASGAKRRCSGTDPCELRLEWHRPFSSQYRRRVCGENENARTRRGGGGVGR
jgi:hypothetical protein